MSMSHLFSLNPPQNHWNTFVQSSELPQNTAKGYHALILLKFKPVLKSIRVMLSEHECIS
jgi:hypothetical protein